MTNPSLLSVWRCLAAVLLLSAGACTQSPAVECAKDADCDDGAFCNGAETCGQEGKCQQGVAPQVDDGRSCTVDSCNEAQDAVEHDASACPACTADANCDDGLFCNGAEHCSQQGACQAGTAPVLDDGIACTVDACDEAADQVTHDASACQPVCGDGKQQGSEACDDGNTEAGDGCDASCALETGWHCRAGTASACVVAIDSCAGAADLTPCEVVTSPDRAYDLCSSGACVSPGCGNTGDCNVPSPTFRVSAVTPRWMREAASNQPVVKDLGTGLEWQGCLRGQTGSDCATGPAVTSPWADAVSYCDALSWAGKDDWRLPSDFELRTLLDYSRSSLALDTKVFPGSPAVSELILWTSTWTAGLTYSTTILFSGASLAEDYTTDDPVARNRHARCVRTFQPTVKPVQSRFARTEPVTGEPIVADALTGLTWQGCQAGKTGASCGGAVSVYSHANAVAYCGGLTWAGFDDWRLPAVDELRSITDPRRNGFGAGASTVDPVAFPNTQPGLTWSSTRTTTFTTSYYQVRFDYRLVSSSSETTQLLVRCMR